jgi:hypothetical protein
MSIIEINVGGTPYVTTRETLCRIKGTMLDKMFSGTLESTKLGSAYFIDRDGRIFQYILQYLRDGDTWNPPMDLDCVQEILREARFFCLEPLIQRLEAIVNTVNTIRPIDTNGSAFIVMVDETTLWTPSSSPESIKAFMGTGQLTNKYVRLQELLNRAYDEGFRLITSQALPIPPQCAHLKILLFFERISGIT